MWYYQKRMTQIQKNKNQKIKNRISKNKTPKKIHWLLTTQTVLCYSMDRQQIVNAWQTPHSLCDAPQTHRTGNHTTIHHMEMFIRSPAVVTGIKYHRININNTCCGYRLSNNTLLLIHYNIYC